MIFFVRHGEPDFSAANTGIYQGFGVHLSGLTKNGIRQIEMLADHIFLKDCRMILSSPYTRALQSAAILSRLFRAEIVVEPLLHEWLADKDTYLPDAEAGQAYKAYRENNGCYPEGVSCNWESVDDLRARVASVLSRYPDEENLIVVCHGMLIESVTGIHPECGEFIGIERSDLYLC
ncbi:MAG: histidine phosphatase family protein [Clostridia bacterium]|nr:histidine phosphatase family protein [Clostridia bacterium]